METILDLGVGNLAVVGALASAVAEMFKFLLPVRLLPDWYRGRAKLLVTGAAVYLVMILVSSEYENFGLSFLVSWLAAGGFYNSVRTVSGVRNKIDVDASNLVRKVIGK